MSNQWHANADRSASGRIYARKTTTFVKDTTIRIAITGTSNPNNAVVDSISPYMKGNSNSSGIPYNSARIARSGGTIVPLKVSNKYLLNNVSEITDLELKPNVSSNTYTRLWYGLSAEGSVSTWAFLPTYGSNMVFGVIESGTVYILSQIETSNVNMKIYDSKFGRFAFCCTNSYLSIISIGNGYYTSISTDLGKTWNRLDNYGNLMFASLTGGIMVSIGLDATDIYYSSSFGTQWTLGDPTGKTGWISIAGADTGDIVFLANSTDAETDIDAGGVWRRTSSTGMFSRLTVGTMTTCIDVWCSTSGAEVLAASIDGLIYYSANTGATWRKISNSGAFTENILHIRAGSSPIETVYILTETKLYILLLENDDIIELSTPTVSFKNNIATITDIYVGSTSSNYAKYTISRDNIPQSGYFNTTTYTDTVSENSHTYSITYYTYSNIATITLNLDANLMQPGSVFISLGESPTYTSLSIEYTAENSLYNNSVFSIIAYKTSSEDIIYPTTTQSSIALFSNLLPGTEYSINVIRTNATKTMTWYYNQYTAPLPPKYVVATFATSTSITIDITPSTGAMFYGIDVMQMSSNDPQIMITDDFYEIDNIPSIITGLVSTTFTGLNPGKPYTIRVAAVVDRQYYLSLGDTMATGILTTLSN